ncbi:hypothetical protein ACQP3D_29150, partial [Escherichia coli]
YKLRTWPLQGMVEGKVFIVDMSQSQLEESRRGRKQLIEHGQLTHLATRGKMGRAREEDRESACKRDQERGKREGGQESTQLR